MLDRFSLAHQTRLPLCGPTLMLVCILSGQSVTAQTSGISGVNIVIKRISTNQGLSNNSIGAIAQDDQGFIWIGTGEGLNRYDGRNITVYRETGDSTSLSNNAIYSLLADREGILWVGTHRGLNRFDPSTRTFKRYLHDPQNPSTLSNDEILSICKDRTGALWVGTRRGLNRFDKTKETWKRYLPTPNDTARPADNSICAILEDHKGTFWIGTGWLMHTGGGLFMFDRSSEMFSRVEHTPPKKGKERNADWVTSIFEDGSRTLWVCASNAVLRLDRTTGTFIRVPLPGGGPSSPSWGGKTVQEDRKGALWIATWGGGLLRYDRRNSTFSNYTYDPLNPGSVSSPAIATLFLDRSGLLWVGTDLGGVNTVATKSFVNRHVLGDSLRIDGRVTALLADKEERLWIYGVGSGLWRYDPKTQKAILIRSRIATNDFCQDSEGKVWFGWGYELWMYDLRSSRARNVLDLPQRGSFWEMIKRMLFDTEGSLWIGTDSSLYRYDRRLQMQALFVHDPRNPGSIAFGGVSSILEDRSGDIWVGTLGGLNGLDKQTQSFKRFVYDEGDSSSLSNSMVLTVFEDRSGVVWIGTNDGLNRFNEASQTFSRFFPADRRKGSSVSHILEDDRGFFWFAWQSGISSFDPSSGIFCHYDESDGIEPVEVLGWPSTRLATGEFVFGTSNGILTFHPDSAKRLAYVPPVVITGIKMFDKPINLATSSELLREMTFEYEENVISIEYAALSYDMSGYNQYAYKLEGFDEEWIYCGNRQGATYTNLDPGEYTFHVKGANHDGVWNEEGASLTVIIVPPWWKTMWAYGACTIVLISALYSIYLFRMNRLRLNHQLEVEHLEAEKMHEVNSMKSRFFANISHEFRTPLTLILGPIEKWMDRLADRQLERRHPERSRRVTNEPTTGFDFAQPDDGEAQRDLSMMKRNAYRLLRLINQLLDLSKLEAGAMKLRACRMNIVPLVKGIAYSFETSAGMRKVELSVVADQDEIEVFCDKDMVEKILTNLLSNAFKFTPEGGAVRVEIRNLQSETPNRIEITIADTGIGIPPEQLNKVFDRFYQVDASQTREHEGSGIGLALVKELVELHHGTIHAQSEVGRGTTFTVRLPLGRSHLKDDEVVDVPVSAEPTSREVYVADADKSVEEAKRKTESEQAKGEKPIVLIVEDNADVRAYIKDYLVSAYQVSEARDGAEGIEKAREIIPDLIISDVMMPKKDGYELCKTLKLDEKTSHIPIILLTAKAASENKIEGLEIGADDYLIKPFEPKELLARVKNLIDLRRKLRERFKASVPLKPGKVAVNSMDDTFLQKAKAVVELHIGEEGFSVEELGKEVGMSRVQLHRKLTALTNQSGSEFIRYMRLHRAMDLLRKNAGTVSEIAYMVGFGKPSNFAKWFQNQFGVRPSDVRKETLAKKEE